MLTQRKMMWHVHMLCLVKNSRTTDSWLRLLVIYDQDNKLKTTMNKPNILLGIAEKTAFSVQGVKVNI
jgi:hypothetical protein